MYRTPPDLWRPDSSMELTAKSFTSFYHVFFHGKDIYTNTLARRTFHVFAGIWSIQLTSEDKAPQVKTSVSWALYKHLSSIHVSQTAYPHVKNYQKNATWEWEWWAGQVHQVTGWSAIMKTKIIKSWAHQASTHGVLYQNVLLCHRWTLICLTLPFFSFSPSSTNLQLWKKRENTCQSDSESKINCRLHNCTIW